MKNLGQMMKQAQEMQSKMHDMQARLADIEIIGRSGGNLVSVTLSGKNELKSLSIDPSLFNSDDLEVVEDLIVAAHADARSKVEETLQKEMQNLLNLQFDQNNYKFLSTYYRKILQRIPKRKFVNELKKLLLKIKRIDNVSC